MKNKHNKKNQIDQVKTTGHSWDGIEEYTNPDPFWLRLVFYITMFFALGYWLLYPSWPAQNQHGILEWTSVKALDKSLDEVAALRKEYQAEFDKASFEEILKDPKLLKFALAGGRSAFQNNCAMCHGVGGGGNIGYPNLTAGAWLWGGKPDDIYTTLKHGIRSTDPETRMSNMAAFGEDGLLTADQINLLTDYVIGLYNNAATKPEAAALYAENCASCHGDKGQGNYEFGAPALNDAIWLYGGDRATVFATIYHGRAGVMPYWSGRLDDSTIRQLTIYVHQLGGGE